MATHKLCPRCGIEKPVSEFGIARERKDGLRPWCRACRKIEGAADFQKHKAKRQATHRKWNERNPDYAGDYARQYYQDNREWLDALNAEWYRQHPDVRNQVARQDYHNNPARYAANAKRWREENPEIVRELNRRYRLNNPELVAAHKRNYKARRKGAEGSHTLEDVAEIRRLQRDRCAMPHCRIHLRGKGHVDHIIALVNDGTNDRRNLQLLCQPCNNQKKAKDQIDFLRSKGFLL